MTLDQAAARSGSSSERSSQLGPSLRPPVRRDRRGWAAVAILAVGLAALRAGVGPSGVVNAGGWGQVTAFFSAMVSPRLDGPFLRLVATEAGVTLAYAVLGTALSLVIGAVGALVLAERLWLPLAGGIGRGRPGWLAARAIFAVPRAIHEVVFGLVLVSVLGLDPLVAVLAIGIPFGAVTAKVFAELLDETPRDRELALRAAGASRLAAFAYGTVPEAVGDLISYGFYRFECALRSAAVLGIVGAGGLGFQLALSFISLRYEEMWTLLWALIILSGLADLWSSAVRRRRNAAAIEMHLDDERRPSPADSPRRDRFVVASAIVGALAVPVAYVLVDIDIANLWSPRARTLGADLAADAWPPTVGPAGFGRLVTDSIDTLALAILSIVGAVALAWPLSFVAARPQRGPARRRSLSAARPQRVAARVVAAATRLVLLIARAVPPPVGAFIAVFVLFPGIWPGALALAIYNAGVLGRLQAEVVENRDRLPADVLVAAGAGVTGAALYGTLPAVVGRFRALGLYRFEVAIRETVLVGVVGAAGLGRRLDEQLTALDKGGVLATVLALIVVTLAVDATSAAARRSSRR